MLPTATAINNAAGQISQNTPNVKVIDSHKKVHAKLKDEKIESLENRMNRLNMSSSSDDD